MHQYWYWYWVIGIGIGQYYWVLGALFGIVLTLHTDNFQNKMTVKDKLSGICISLNKGGGYISGVRTF